MLIDNALHTSLVELTVVDSVTKVRAEYRRHRETSVIDLQEVDHIPDLREGYHAALREAFRRTKARALALFSPFDAAYSMRNCGVHLA